MCFCPFPLVAVLRGAGFMCSKLFAFALLLAVAIAAADVAAVVAAGGADVL